MYLGGSNRLHRQAIARLLASEHPFAVEVLRRVQPDVPRAWRVCRYCRRRGAVETEAHVLMECVDDRVVQLRDAFLHDASLLMGNVIPNRFNVWPPLRFLDFLLS